MEPRDKLVINGDLVATIPANHPPFIVEVVEVCLKDFALFNYQLILFVFISRICVGSFSFNLFLKIFWELFHFSARIGLGNFTNFPR